MNTNNHNNNNNNSTSDKSFGLSTRSIHIGQDPEQWSSWSVIPPITMSTTFKQPSPANPKIFDYGRSGNPSRNVLETCLAGIESARYSLVFSSGLGAMTAIGGLLKCGDEIICCDDVYGGTGRLFRSIFINMGINVVFVDATDPANIERELTQQTKIIWIETPTNPLLKVIDIEHVSKICRGRFKHVILVVDNTFLTPCFQKPLTLGADLVIYSLTKYMNGHCDVVMGSIATDNQTLYEKLRFLQNSMGIVPSPFDCQMVNRGLKTLELRMNRHMESSLKIAAFLQSHPKIEKVLHPLLKSHDQYKLTMRQTTGHSGMLSFYLRGDLEKTKEFLAHLKLFTLAESLGGFESLIEIPSLMTHASIPIDVRAKLQITDNLIRISVGLENVEDLLDDLNNALQTI